jgi:hypothetical protein
MRRSVTLLLALVALLVLLSLTRSARAQVYPACNEAGWPGGYYAYCVAGSSDLVAKSWTVPDGTVLYELCGMDASYNRLVLLQPYWLELQKRETQAMPEAARWAFVPTRETPCRTLRFAAAWPGELWVPDLEVLEPARVWVPLVQNTGH